MKTLIVDHEPRARAELRDLCEADDNVDEVAVAECGTTAIEMIGATRPELLFLNVELRDMTGFDVLRALDDYQRPATIMVARDDRYAVEARSFAATDYLTRPISADRLALALKRACFSLRRVGRKVGAQELPTHERVEIRYPSALTFGDCDRLVGERGGRIYFFSPTEVDYIEADSNYVKIHVGSERYINRDSLTRLAVLLQSVGFVRIRRSVLLNLQRVSFAEREGRGVLAFVLNSGGRLVSSSRFRLEAGAQFRAGRIGGARRKSRIT